MNNCAVHYIGGARVESDGRRHDGRLAGRMVAEEGQWTYIGVEEATMGAIESDVFRSGDRIAVSLPEEWAAKLGTRVSITRDGPGVTIQPVRTPEESLLRNRKLVEEIRAIWAEDGPPEPEKRDPDIFPDRPGLY